jgi:2-succinyl-5-enolpyruvyl-6-hydroxy-3-cyclohexene-1-carboxylate synthase
MVDPGQSFAATFVDQLAASGIRLACISPGSRSAPLAMALARHPAIRVFTHVDERSGSYFALGLARRTEMTVAILCTSGTAAVQFHAAVVEAFYSATPLLVLTADRPPELRDVGAGQAIDQVNLYGGATRWSCDFGVPAAVEGSERVWRRLAARAVATSAGPPAGPVHLNVSFQEPLVTEPGVVPEPIPGRGPLVLAPSVPAATEAQVEEVSRLVASARRPMLVLGEMRDGARLAAGVAALTRKAGAVVVAEPTSQLRRATIPGLVVSAEALLRDPGFAAAHAPDLVLRVGGTPTSRVVNQFLAAHPPHDMVLVDPLGRWNDPDALSTMALHSDPGLLLEAICPRIAAPGAAQAGWQRDWVEADAVARVAVDRALDASPLFEGHAVRALARALPSESTVVAGNSMPVRDVDWFWPADPGRRFLASRGASGIDGLVSMGLGVGAASPEPTAVVVGDLTLYHDMNGLWAIRRHRLNPLIVVLNNNGGGIFSFLPQAEHRDVFDEVFGTPLDLDLQKVADLYGLRYLKVTEAGGLDAALGTGLEERTPTMVDVQFSREASVAGHRSAWTAVGAALSGRPAVSLP